MKEKTDLIKIQSKMHRSIKYANIILLQFSYLNRIILGTRNIILSYLKKLQMSRGLGS